MMQQASDHPCIDQPNDHPYTLEMISTSVLLSIFEAMQSTTPTAYHAHVDGAVRMIEHTGPGECYQGALCQLFFHVRTQMAFVNLTTRTCLKVQMHRILVEHLEYTRLPIFQQLMDHIGILAEAYVQGDGSEESSRSTSSHTESSPKMPEPAYLDVKAGIERLYTEYTTQAAERGEVLISHPFLPLPPSPIGTKAPTGIYRDPFTALTLSYFSATRILLSLLSPPSQSPSTASAFPAEPKDTLHFSQILSAASYLAISRIGFTYMRMAVPLFLVAAHSPDPVQRREARAVFEEWGRGNMRGISALALQRLGKEEKKGKEQEEGEGEGEGRDVGRKEPKEKENEEEGTKEPHVCRELRDLFRTVSAGGQTGAGITL